MSSYEIEHRLKAESEASPEAEFCAECKNECTGTWEDVGIGSFEFWGSRGHDSRWAYMSDCCEAEVIKAGQLYEGPEWDEGDEADRLYDQMKDDELMRKLEEEGL
jgi:hypothetical protein